MPLGSSQVRWAASEVISRPVCVRQHEDSSERRTGSYCHTPYAFTVLANAPSTGNLKVATSDPFPLLTALIGWESLRRSVGELYSLPWLFIGGHDRQLLAVSCRSSLAANVSLTEAIPFSRCRLMLTCVRVGRDCPSSGLYI